jgi:hypothetical protein
MPVSSFLAKIDRAREHLEDLESATAAWEVNACDTVEEVDPNPPRKRQSYDVHLLLRVTRVEPIPQRFGLIIGDCLFNLRSALDHLALALALKCKPGMSDREIRDSEFPVFATETGYQREETRKIGCMDTAAQAIIESLQPYHGKNGLEREPLWQLHDLNRIDKHRQLTICVAANKHITTEQNASGEIIDGLYCDVIDGALSVDAVVCQYGYRTLDPSAHVDMKAIPAIQVALRYGNPVQTLLVVQALEALCKFVSQDVVAKLAQFL